MRQFFFSLAFCASFAFLGQAFSVENSLKTTVKNTMAVPSFLPPVASINGKITAPDSLLNSPPDEAVTLDANISKPVLGAVKTNPTTVPTRISVKTSVKPAETKAETQAQQEQKQHDTEALEHLWQATVEKNPVIRYAIEKLNTPSDLQTRHASRFAVKTLNMMLSGAALGTMFLPGTSSLQQLGTMAGRDILSNLTLKNADPQTSLSATEQIQLAGLVDELKSTMVKQYYTYKNTLILLAQAHADSAELSQKYATRHAQKTAPDKTILAAAAYYQAYLYEDQLRQQARYARQYLQKLAGEPAVKTLSVLPTLVMSTANNADSPPMIQDDELSLP